MNADGVYAPIPTPITDDGTAVAADELEAYVESLVAGGVDGILPCGSIGEFPSLTREQRRTVIETVVDGAGGTAVLAGCCATGVESVLKYARDAADAGADAALVATPYYLEATPDGLRRFFAAVADDSPLPVYLYDVPARTGVRLPPAVIRDLADHPGIEGIKDTSGDVSKLYSTVEATPPSFSVMQGSSVLSIASLDAGVDGLVAGPADVFPGAVAELYAAYRDGNRDRAVDLHNAVVHPLVDAMRDLPTATAIKHMVDLTDHQMGPPLPPLSPLEEGDGKALARRYETVRGWLEDPVLGTD